MPQLDIPCLLMRGGTSKGPYFLAGDLPDERSALASVLLRLMGSPDVRQIDGLGGGTSLTSKVCIISPSQREDADVDYLFAQVRVKKKEVDFDANCGNMLSGVGPFALERGLVPLQEGKTKVRVYNLNVGEIIHLTMQTPDGFLTYVGDTEIAGVPGQASPIRMDFFGVAGPSSGHLFPTGSPIDDINGVEVTCIDSVNPIVLMTASSLGKTGQETKEELDKDEDLLQQLQDIRVEAGQRMGMGDVTEHVVPKIAYLSPPRDGGTVCSRYFTPNKCHAAHAISGGIAIGLACVSPGTVAAPLAEGLSGNEPDILVEHCSGILKVHLSINSNESDPTKRIISAGAIRTARPIMDGRVLVPDGLVP
mgnify:CR=1 FL=1